MDIVLVKTTVLWNDDSKTERVLDIMNKDATSGMLRVFRAAMAKGANKIEIAPYEQEGKEGEEA